jgi:hypothetical protein
MKIHTHRLEKTVKKTLIASGILLMLAIAGGMAYVYFGNKTTNVPEVVANTVPIDPVPTHQEPGPNAPESAAIQYLESPVKAGNNSTVTVTTGPNSKCTIVVAYSNVISKDSGLAPKTADEHGSVTWTWTVDANAPAGKWPVKVTCVRNNKTGFVQGDLVVTK